MSDRMCDVLASTVVCNLLLCHVLCRTLHSAQSLLCKARRPNTSRAATLSPPSLSRRTFPRRSDARSSPHEPAHRSTDPHPTITAFYVPSPTKHDARVSHTHTQHARIIAPTISVQCVWRLTLHGRRSLCRSLEELCSRCSLRRRERASTWSANTRAHEAPTHRPTSPPVRSLYHAYASPSIAGLCSGV